MRQTNTRLLPARGKAPDRIPGILATVDLVGLVEHFTGTPGKQDGSRRRLPCPHPDHADTDPSFVVYPRKRPPDFYCYGCGWGGDAITLVMGVRGVSRQQSIEYLAAELNLCDPSPACSQQPTPNREKGRRRASYDAGELEAFVVACHAGLTAPARAYLTERGVRPAEIARWRLGYGVTGHPRFRTLQRRLILPCPDGIEARLIPGHTPAWQPGERYVVPPGDPKRAWGIDRIDPARGPLVLVEGALDAIALERIDVQAVALRCKRIRPADAAEIRAAGFRHAYLSLDATPDVTLDIIRALIRALADADVTARIARGPDRGDWAELLTLPDDLLAEAVLAGMVTP